MYLKKLPEITVKSVIENEDGSESVELDLDAEAVKLLLTIGFTQLLAEHLESTKGGKT
jgi:hypothetical protein